MEQADGTPFFVIGDTWYATGANRFKWYDDERERPMGPTAGFKDYVRHRKAQGYNKTQDIRSYEGWAYCARQTLAFRTHEVSKAGNMRLRWGDAKASISSDVMA